ncbi:MAG: type I methionyl aminopeptidase [Fibrobacterota bacterium]
MINIRSLEEIEKISESADILARTFEMVGEKITPGMTSFDLDREIESFIREKGARPAFLGYSGFPGSACISLNDTVVHGIPSKSQVFKVGDLVSVDIGVDLNGYFSDSAYTFTFGQIKKREVKNLLETTQKALFTGIEATRVGNRVSDISAAVDGVIKAAGCSAVKVLVGHGIGTNLHEDPQIPNYISKNNDRSRIENGMIFAIEPMVNLGAHSVYTEEDGWTVKTEDGSLSAHFEHTVAVVDGGPKILTDNRLEILY